MAYWAKAPVPREQIVLIATTLDDRIPDDHVVRVFAEILSGYDWSAWEARYHQGIGQPPIHPRILATVWLYGLRRGVRSSRRLEYTIKHNVDFMWLAEGHTPDHSTLNGFRTRFGSELKDLFKHLARVAMEGGFLELVDVATDGTRVKANNSRFETWNAERIAKALEELQIQFENQLAQARENDQREDEQPGKDIGERLPPELADLAARREKLREIQKQLQEADLARKKDGIDPQKNPAQIPKHDPDSRVLPNKEKGYAPNYTPMLTTEGHGGYIVDADVTASANEHQELIPSLDRITETFGKKPENALADGAFATGTNIAATETRGIEFFSHIPAVPERDNPAVRADPTQPVPETQWERLPLNPQTKKLEKSCFLYDREQDLYYCPRGQPLPYEETKTDLRQGERIAWRIYRCGTCAGCPLAARCIAATNTGGRTVRRDVHTPERERLAAKMQTPEARARYDQRMRIAETPFGFIKHVMGLRQFLLRGLEKVKIEWSWIAATVNLSKLARDLRRSCVPISERTAAPATN